MFTQKRICVHIRTKNVGIFYQNSDEFLVYTKRGK